MGKTEHTRKRQFRACRHDGSLREEERGGGKRDVTWLVSLSPSAETKHPLDMMLVRGSHQIPSPQNMSMIGSCRIRTIYMGLISVVCAKYGITEDLCETKPIFS